MITFAISTYNNYFHLKGIVQDLSMQKDLDFNVFVHDNTPPDLIEDDNFIYLEDVKNIISNFSNFFYLHSECNGLSDSRNICVDYCKTEYIHFLDDDVSIYGDFSIKVKEAIKNMNNPDAIGGKALPDWSFVSKPDWFFEELYPMLSILDFGNAILDYKTQARWLVGANLLIKKAKILEFGGFDLSLGRKGDNLGLLSSEENDLLNKIYDSGGKIFYNPCFSVKHYLKKHQVTKSWLIKRVAWQAVSDIMTNENWILEAENQTQRIQSVCSQIFHKDSSDFYGLIQNIQLLTHKILLGKVLDE